MFECLDRNNDKELSLDEFSHALKRRNLEKLFPRRAARVLDASRERAVGAEHSLGMGRVDGVGAAPSRNDTSHRCLEKR